MTLDDLLDRLPPKPTATPGYEYSQIERAERMKVYFANVRLVRISAMVTLVQRAGARDVRGPIIYAIARFRSSYSVIELLARRSVDLVTIVDSLPRIVPIKLGELKDFTTDTPFVKHLARRGMLLYRESPR